MKGRLSSNFQKLFIVCRDLQVWILGRSVNIVSKHQQLTLQAWIKRRNIPHCWDLHLNPQNLKSTVEERGEAGRSQIHLKLLVNYLCCVGVPRLKCSVI